jgi:hypothetical protein
LLAADAGPAALASRTAVKSAAIEMRGDDTGARLVLARAKG